ncbi:MAG: hypothetical protein K2F86_07470 [Duncaniella sp.]|nr:hypothetical protein [Duncaniella sp.]
MSRHHAILLLAALGLGSAPMVCAQSQDQPLHKDITVESETPAEHRDANRIQLLPGLDLPPVKTPPLGLSGRTVTARVPNTLSTLPPVAWADPDDASRYRGYVRGGLFPLLFNAEVAAGYRLVAKERTALGISANYAGDIYRRESRDWTDHSLDAALRLRQKVASTGRFDLDFTYRYGVHNQIAPTYDGDGVRNTETMSANNPRLSLGYSGKTSGFSYEAGVRGDMMFLWINGLGDVVGGPALPSSTAQYGYGISARGAIDAGENSHVELGVDLDGLRSDEKNTPRVPFDGSYFEGGKANQAILDINPRYILRTDVSEVSVGARIDLAFNAGKFFNIAPDVTLAWMPVSVFSAQVKLGGGVTHNAISDLYHSVSPYMSPGLAYSPSRMPWSIDGLLTAGPFMNTTVELRGGYARAKGWLMPVESDYYYGGTAFEAQKLSGAYWSVALGYDNGNTFALKARYTGAPSSQYHGWYEFRDRARHVVDVRLSVRPIERLLVSADWEFRSGRSMYAYGRETDESGLYPVSRVALGSVSDLGLTADWAFSDRLHGFVKATNLMNRSWRMIGDRPSRGVCGLVGASYKF